VKPSDKEFIAEADETLQEAERLLLELQEAGANPEVINALFRAFHTLKGLAGLFGHQGITDLSHALEGLLDDLRLGRTKFSDELVEFLLQSTDTLKALVKAVKEGTSLDVAPHLRAVEEFRRLHAAQQQGPSLEGLIDGSILKVLSQYEEHRLRDNIRQGLGIYMLRKVFSMEEFDKALQGITARIKELGELLSTLPSAEGVPEGHLGFSLLFASRRPLQSLREELDPEVQELLETKAPKAETKPLSLKSTSSTVRVDIEKLDRILNTIGEMALTKAAVKRVAEELREHYGYAPLVLDVYKIFQSLDRRLEELQAQVLEIRMVPVGQIFSRLAQVIRRYGRESGKQIEVLMYGEDTEIDKYLAEEVIDPLVHIARNAIDHGIEPPEERKRAGKKPTGTITLRAYQRGNHVLIEVSDDGRGISAKALRDKAVRMGLLEPGAELQRRELLELIFTPGFSTKETASEVSGRGVGLDIVRDKLSLLGGFAEVSTTEGQGTTFTLTLPITLAIIKALMVRVGQERFAIPLTSIAETTALRPQELQRVEGREVYNLRGNVLPVARVAHIFDLQAEQSERLFMVVVGVGERKLGLLVDELLGQQEVVIKSLGGYFKPLRGFAGAAEVGRHEVVLVMDVEAVMEESLSRHRGALNV
jgi:two-component system chemotaxis sensor kinase CheA